MENNSAEITRTVNQRFTDIALTPDSEKKFRIGIESAKALGYDAHELAGLPQSATESFCGVGNPFLMGVPQHGQTVLDIGCGAGLDCIIAAQCVGAEGRVIGLDMTEAMIEKARKNASVVGLTNIEFHVGRAENVPLADASVDVAISNGLLNLCFDKESVLAEMFRVLRPAGRLQMCDILLHDEVTPAEVAQLGTWSD